jgi:two-component system NtrC family sensor kinase
VLETRSRGAIAVKLSRMFNRSLVQQPALQLIYDTAPIGLAVLSLDCRYLKLNQRLTEICGISVEDHLGRSVRDCVPALADAVEGIVRSIMSTGEPVAGIEVTSQRTDKTEDRWWVTYWHPLRDPKGEIIGVNVAAEEVTERKRAEAALQESERQFHTLADSIASSEARYHALVRALSTLVWTTEADGGQIGEMPEWRALTGQTFDEVQGWGWLNALHPDDRKHSEIAWQTAVETQSVFQTEFRIRRWDGEYVWHQARGVPIHDQDGSIREWVGVCVDIQDKKRAAQQQMEAEAALRDLNVTLEQSLQQQTATADALRMISRSALDLDAIMNTLSRSASELCGADMSGLFLRDNGYLIARGVSGMEERLEKLLRTNPVPVDDQTYGGRAVLTGAIINLADVDSDEQNSRLLAFQKAFGYKSLLVVPLMREGRGVGVFALVSNRTAAFSQRQIDLVQTYADQAVIAIENARLFNETKKALERQTATADILKVIASSPDDVQPVFEAIAERSNRLVDGLSTSVFSVVDDVVRLMSFTSVNASADAALKAITDVPLSAFPFGEAMRKGEIAQIADTEDEATPDLLRDVARLRGWRSSLTVPMLREGILIGIIAITRVAPGLFDDHHVELLKTFADQAKIAISNVGLFNEVQDRTLKLSQSLDDLRAAQVRLVQTEKLASLGQLTAGIAHEIKNPLNFVNNFSALSAELTDELNDVLKPVVLDRKVRGEVDELTGLLKDNLDKVVQHGKRADSIVKNMLLHSREGSGEQRRVDINTLVRESLNLAYHGARAEMPRFNITLEESLDPSAGEVDVFPQEITRVLLNLISNGFYATMARKAQLNGVAYEPTVSASTQNLGDRVEIRIRDNGTGIPPGVKEKMFDPFFTTKPAGEGTGLGLSLSHDVIVKQHAGAIEVETQPDAYTEFRIVLPRTIASIGAGVLA